MNKYLSEFNDKDRECYELLRSKCEKSPIYYVDKGALRWLIMPAGVEGYRYVYLDEHPTVKHSFITSSRLKMILSSSALVQREEALPYAHRS